MIRVIFTVLTVFALQCSGCGDNDSGSRVERTSSHDWKTSFSESVQLSADSGKPILAFFTGSNWCGWCKVLNSKILETPVFVEWAKENVIMLELDFPTDYEQSQEIKDQNQQLQKMYGITGFPTIIVMDANGKPILQLGYEDVSPDVYAAKIESAIKKSQTLLKTN